MEVKLLNLLGIRTDKPTNKIIDQRTDTPSHREVSLPIKNIPDALMICYYLYSKCSEGQLF